MTTKSSGIGRFGFGKSLVVTTDNLLGPMFDEVLKSLPHALRKCVTLRKFRDWAEWVKAEEHESHEALVISRLSDVPDEPPVGGHSQRTRHLLFTDDMPIEAISSRVTRLNVHDPGRLHVSTKPQSKAAQIMRVLCRTAASEARPSRSHATRIFDAWIEKDALVVLSPAFDRLRVPLADLKKFIGTDRKKIESFDIDEDGSFLFWPHADVHMGWSQFEQIVCPTALIAAMQRTRQFNERYGAAIRSLRELRGLTQADIAGLTDRHLRRIEQGKIAATSSALTKLAKAHGISLTDYLDALAKHLN